jgi:hypothetical protein
MKKKVRIILILSFAISCIAQFLNWDVIVLIGFKAAKILHDNEFLISVLTPIYNSLFFSFLIIMAPKCGPGGGQYTNRVTLRKERENQDQPSSNR